MATQARFTVSEANALLPELTRIFERLRALERELGARANELERLGVRELDAASNALSADLAERRRILEARRADFDREIEKIGELGAILKDLELGVVDFRGAREGKEVHFCWQLGEDEISHFHGPNDDDFRGRRRL